MTDLVNNQKYYSVEDFNRAFQSGKGLFKALHINCRSIKRKVDDIANFIWSIAIGFDVLVFSETWITYKEDAPFFPGYSHELLCRNQQKGGGLAIYFKDTLSSELLDKYTVMNDDVECITMCVGPFIVIGVYRPPHGHKKKFIEFLNVVLSTVRGNTPCIVMGDINIDLCSNDPYAKDFETLLLTYGSTNFIRSPTRITSTSATLLDICASNLSSQNIKSGVFAYDISDHMPIFFLARVTSQIGQKTETSFHRIKNSKTREHFFQLVQNIDWTTVYRQENPDDAYNTFMTLLSTSYDAAFPLQKRSRGRNKKCRKPWINRDLYRRIKIKNKLYHDFIRSRNTDALAEYKKYRNVLNSEIRKAKQNYYEKLFESIYNDQRKLWEVINGLTNRNKGCNRTQDLTINGQIFSGERLANVMNEHFINAGSFILTDEKRDNAPTPDKSPLPYSIFLAPTDPVEVERLIRKLKNNVASGIDEIGSVELKMVSPLISNVLAYIINLTLTNGVFPEQLKVAKVTAVHKGGDINTLANYRPISVLPTISKIFEGVIYDRLASFFDKHQIITKSQYGFQKNKSTEQALLYIKDKIIENMENKKYTLGLFLDLQKAFDSIQFKSLIHKLSSYGVRGVALQLFKSYLEDRYQYVKLNNTISAKIKLNQGVPQGSILGPLLFLVYINDIVDIPHSPELIMYADDTNVFFSSDNLISLEVSVNNYLSNLSNWLRQNGLRLNAKKKQPI